MPRLSLIVATCKKFFLENLYLLTYKNLKTIHGLKSTFVKKFKKTKQKNREGTNCMHRNRGNLTVGLKTKTVEMVGIIFPRPQPQNLRFWE
jgi:hypothetical protein